MKECAFFMHDRARRIYVIIYHDVEGKNVLPDAIEREKEYGQHYA